MRLCELFPAVAYLAAVCIELICLLLNSSTLYECWQASNLLFFLHYMHLRTYKDLLFVRNLNLRSSILLLFLGYLWERELSRQSATEAVAWTNWWISIFKGNMEKLPFCVLPRCEEQCKVKSNRQSTLVFKRPAELSTSRHKYAEGSILKDYTEFLMCWLCVWHTINHLSPSLISMYRKIKDAWRIVSIRLFIRSS